MARTPAAACPFSWKTGSALGSSLAVLPSWCEILTQSMAFFFMALVLVLFAVAMVLGLAFMDCLAFGLGL